MQQTAVSTMKAWLVNAYGPPQNARVGQVDVPKIKEGHLLVRVHAAGVNPWDYKVVTGAVKDWAPVNFPYIPGMDGSGEIIEVGSGVSNWSKGDAIIAKFPRGTFAEYAVISASDKHLARKPDRLDFKHAAALPVGAMTASTIVRAAELRPGQTVLVIGATGGVGSFLTQLLKANGVRIIATGKPNDVEYLSDLGADEVVDYTKGDTVAQVLQRHAQGVDAVIDVINSGDALLDSARVLREGGTLVSTLDGPEQSAFPKDAKVRYIQMEAQEGELEDLAQRAAGGKLRVEIGHAYDLERAGQALDDLMDRAKHTRGKFVIQIVPAR